MVRSLAPFLRGEGWGEGLLPHKRQQSDSRRAPSPDRFAIDLSPQAGEVKKTYTAGFGSPAIAQAARNVFTSRQATVI
ncbi:hypothetical protein ACVIN2_004092 [Bradyrhizobium sp. USDA 3650]